MAIAQEIGEALRNWEDRENSRRIVQGERNEAMIAIFTNVMFFIAAIFIFEMIAHGMTGDLGVWLGM